MTYLTVENRTGRFGLWVWLMAVVMLIGVALVLRDPEIGFEPQMAGRPVLMPDGAVLYVQKYEVSVAEWNRCYAAGVCAQSLRAPEPLSDAETPATGLSFLDVSQYLTWINGTSDQVFRLPTLEEWETMAAEVRPAEADPIFTDPRLSWASDYITGPQTARALRPRGSFETTAQGIVDLNGSVWEWTQECYSGEAGKPVMVGECPAFYVGGDHIAVVPFLVRDPARGGCAVGAPPAHLGMRLVSETPD